MYPDTIDAKILLINRGVPTVGNDQCGEAWVSVNKMRFAAHVVKPDACQGPAHQPNWLITASYLFATRNNGVYPDDTSSDINLDGDTLRDLLPGGILLENPFTGARTEPVDASAANPGETGLVDVKHCGDPVGYTITGYGATSDIVTLVYVGPCN